MHAGKPLVAPGSKNQSQSESSALESLPAPEDALARVILASIGEAVIATNLDARIVTINSEAERLTGWSRQQSLGQAIDDVFKLVDIDKRTPIACPAAAAMHEGRSIRVERDTLLLSRDGREFIVEVSAAPVRRHGSAPLFGAVLICRDVSDTRHLQRCIAWQAGHDTILRHADQAMYCAKQTGRNRYQLFDPKRTAATPQQ